MLLDFVDKRTVRAIFHTISKKKNNTIKMKASPDLGSHSCRKMFQIPLFLLCLSTHIKTMEFNIPNINLLGIQNIEWEKKIWKQYCPFFVCLLFFSLHLSYQTPYVGCLILFFFVLFWFIFVGLSHVPALGSDAMIEQRELSFLFLK